MHVLASLLLAAAAAKAHYTFPDLVANGQPTGDWVNVIKTTHWQNNGFVGDVTSTGIRCDALQMGSAKTYNVTAGSSIGFTANPNIYHPGPVQMYMAKVPAGKTAATWDGSGSVWFKVYQEQPKFGSQLTWPNNGASRVTVTVPKCLQNGEYLFRIEHIALHVAQSSGGAQFYISCGQISLSGGGNTAGSPTVAFPGAIPLLILASSSTSTIPSQRATPTRGPRYSPVKKTFILASLVSTPGFTWQGTWLLAI